jgi:hypothetical protein
LTFYTPQENVDVSYGPVPDELDSPEAIFLSSATIAAPALTPPPAEPLEYYASLAFPGSRLERKKAKAKKAPAKKAAAKKAPAKKAAAKKAPAKKAAAKKAPAKKAAAKKAPARKAAH